MTEVTCVTMRPYQEPLRPGSCPDAGSRTGPMAEATIQPLPAAQWFDRLYTKRNHDGIAFDLFAIGDK